VAGSVYCVIGSGAVAVARTLGSGTVAVLGSKSAVLELVLSETPVPDPQPRGSRKERYSNRRMSRFMIHLSAGEEYSG
jgi:hypothetical protein